MAVGLYTYIRTFHCRWLLRPFSVDLCIHALRVRQKWVVLQHFGPELSTERAPWPCVERVEFAQKTWYSFLYCWTVWIISIPIVPYTLLGFAFGLLCMFNCFCSPCFTMFHRISSAELGQGDASPAWKRSKNEAVLSLVAVRTVLWCYMTDGFVWKKWYLW